ncbi:TIGR03826 family flagellar region protein [Shouchella clausii]|uniref:TIGR03826 family flagellar region protein n=1 Tax=Shouchella clausii TaxID=79880 RepID=UPI000B968105|nr:TIGR03826 family flagellar region protein [Shouchella clausii]AST96709.1 hypothetical protein BC8716_12430 [Shouchella clausii]MCR1289658.1 hypothetical protein [Shouchella clausii]MEB5473659.1 hypothetical protein [Shouchella clausii]QNM43067.1 hypothetical protein DUT88_09290 [Shouchella clausii]WQG94071.1 TIGR03826 family flagellar region protein [Shouchella clausii]
MAELANCQKCGAVFVKNIHSICRSCHEEEERCFQKVNQFLRKRENRSATKQEVVDGTGVSYDMVQTLIRKGRLQLRHFPNLYNICERCKQRTKEPWICHSCREEMKRDLANSGQQSKPAKRIDGEQRSSYRLQETLHKKNE